MLAQAHEALDGAHECSPFDRVQTPTDRGVVPESN
jgi:hypothetical protein